MFSSTPKYVFSSKSDHMIDQFTCKLQKWMSLVGKGKSLPQKSNQKSVCIFKQMFSLGTGPSLSFNPLGFHDTSFFKSVCLLGGKTI